MDRNAAYTKYRHDQILFCDETVRQFIPKSLQKLTTYLGNNLLARIIYFLVDTIYLAKILKIRVENSENKQIIGGNGFRKGVSAMRINSVTTRIFKGDKQIAEKTFPIGIIIK